MAETLHHLDLYAYVNDGVIRVATGDDWFVELSLSEARKVAIVASARGDQILANALADAMEELA